MDRINVLCLVIIAKMVIKLHLLDMENINKRDVWAAVCNNF